jgi:cytoskeletal protein CcmA (bactofilin family)
VATEHDEPAAPKPPEDIPDTYDPTAAGPSIIGMTLVMRGELTLDEDLIIEGTFDGTTINGARNLSIGSFANVKAHIEGESADIAGKIDGDFRGSGTVVLHKTARITGEISANRVCIEDGTNLERAIVSGCISRIEEDS